MKARQHSLAVRLSLGLGLGLGLFLLLQWLLISALMRQLSAEYLGSRLGHDAESLAAALEISPDGLPLLDPERLNPTFTRPFSGHYYRLRYRGIEFSSRSLWYHSLPLDGDAGEGLRRVPGPQGQSLLLLQRKLSLGHETLLLAVAEELGPLERSQRRFDHIYALASLLLLLLLLGLQHWLIRGALRPLHRASAELAALGQAGAGSAQLGEAVPAEILPLVQAINRLLSMQQQRLERSRNALADLSHALKAPLTRIQQLLDTRPWPELAAEVLSMRQRVEHQLARARLAGGAPLQAGLSLQDLLAELLPALQKLYADKPLHFELKLPAGLQLRLERQDALELLGNLLDNACKWASGRVEIRASVSDRALIEIRDDGAGVPPHLLDQLSRRGLRADQQMPGHGLGLAIAQDLIQSYGGELSLSSSPQGFCVRIHLPAAVVVPGITAQAREPSP